jgi:uncharacterized membrane protein YeiH
VDLGTLLTAIEAAGTLAFFVAGLLVAVRKRLDVVGSFSVAVASAFGGGTLRDLLLDRRPFFWVEHSLWLWLLLALTVVAMRLLRPAHLESARRAIQWPDALGMGLFAASGSQIALDHGMPALVAALMGAMTAVCGGVLRDIACAEIPVAFNDHQPYAICAFAGGWAVVLANHLGWDPGASLAAGAALAVALRMWALKRDVRLPAWRSDDRRP